MLVAIHQPNYLPWLGYLDRMAKADLFVVLDHVQFERRNYQNRTQIRVPIDDTHTWVVYLHFVPASEGPPAGGGGEVPIDYRPDFKNPSDARHPFTTFRMDEVDAQDFMECGTPGITREDGWLNRAIPPVTLESSPVRRRGR